MQKYHLYNLRLSPDAVEGGVAPVGDVPSVLDQDLGSVDTSFPLLRAGLYDMEIASCDLVDNKDKTGKNVLIKLKTTQDSLDVKGQPLNRGMKLSSYIGLTESEKYNKDAIARNCALFVQAVGCGITKMLPLSQFVGKIVRVKIQVRPAEGQYEAANDVKWVPAPKA